MICPTSHDLAVEDITILPDLNTPHTAISLNNWHHIAYVIDHDSTPAKGFIYIDGVNQSGTGVEFPQLTGELNIPAAIYGSALTAAKFLDHYQNP